MHITFFFFFFVKGGNFIDDKYTWHVTTLTITMHQGHPGHYNSTRPSGEATAGLQTKQLCRNKTQGHG